MKQVMVIYFVVAVFVSSANGLKCFNCIKTMPHLNTPSGDVENCDGMARACGVLHVQRRSLTEARNTSLFIIQGCVHFSGVNGVYRQSQIHEIPGLERDTEMQELIRQFGEDSFVEVVTCEEDQCNKLEHNNENGKQDADKVEMDQKNSGGTGLYGNPVFVLTLLTFGIVAVNR